MLLQHGRDGDRSGAVAENRVQQEDREVDGDSEERSDLRAGFSAPVSVGVRGTRGAN